MPKKLELIKLAEELLNKAGFNQLPAQERQNYIEQLAKQLADHLLLTLVKALPAGARKKFSQLDPAKLTPEEAFKFLRKKVPRYQQQVEEALVDFSAQFLQQAQKNKSMFKSEQ